MKFDWDLFRRTLKGGEAQLASMCQYKGIVKGVVVLEVKDVYWTMVGIFGDKLKQQLDVPVEYVRINND